MSFLLTSVTSTGKTAFPLDLPVFPVSRDLRGNPAQCLREDNWENEGGHLATARLVIASSAISAGDVEVLTAQVNVMESTLASEFANGRVGTRYNTYAHRSRVLRQQKAKLDALRASSLAQEQRL
jgi:hypothetical protein